MSCVTILIDCVHVQFAAAVLGERDTKSSVHLWRSQVGLGRLLSGGHCTSVHRQLLTVRTSPGQGM